jgi:hypothetical protein
LASAAAFAASFSSHSSCPAINKLFLEAAGSAGATGAGVDAAAFVNIPLPEDADEEEEAFSAAALASSADFAAWRSALFMAVEVRAASTDAKLSKSNLGKINMWVRDDHHKESAMNLSKGEWAKRHGGGRRESKGGQFKVAHTVGCRLREG